MISDVISKLAKNLVSYSNVNKKLEETLLWYLSPEQHVSEMIIANVIFGTGLILTLKHGKGNDSNQTTKSNENTKNNKSEDQDVNHLNPIMKTFRVLLTTCFLVTLGHKWNGDKLALMLMPCHFTTVFYLTVLYARKKSTATSLFNISAHYMFFTFLAILLPDFKGLDQRGEILNFWVHHWTLFFFPFYVLFSNQYKIDHSKHYYFRLALFIGALFHFDAMSLAGLIYGHNVGYMLYPPPKTPVKGPWFRWAHASFLIIFGWISGYVIPYGVEKIRNLMIQKEKLKNV